MTKNSEAEKYSLSKYRYKTETCQLCERTTALTFHHLIPRKMHRRTYFRKNFDKAELNSGIWICRKCHSGIHKLFDEMTLAKEFYSLEKLQRSEVIMKHVNWVAKQRVTSR